MKIDVGPVVTVPTWVIRHRDLSAVDVRVYCGMLARCAEYGEADAPTRTILAQDLNVSIDTIKRSLRALERAGAVSTTHTRGEASIYCLHIACPPLTNLVHTYPESVESPGVHSSPGLMATTSSGAEMHRATHVRRTTLSTDLNTKTIALSAAVKKVEMPRFDRLFGEWPIQAAKHQSRQRWNKLNLERDHVLWTEVARGAQRWVHYWETSGTKRSHIPYLSTWLAHRRWEDRPVPDDPDAEDRKRAVAFLKEIPIDD